MIILASASPRRRELLSRLGIPFDVRPVSVIEEVESGNPVIVASRPARVEGGGGGGGEARKPVPAKTTAPTDIYPLSLHDALPIFPFDVRPVSVIEEVESGNPVIVASRLARMKAE